MFKHVSRLGSSVVLLLLLAAPACADQDFRKFLKPPETPQEWWDSLTFEINVGKFDLAAGYLKGLLAAVKDKDDELLNLEEKPVGKPKMKVGLSAFVRLRLITKWSDDPAVQKEAKANVVALLEQYSAALRKQLNDPVRIAKFTKNLAAPTREERGYALMILQRSGAAVMPHLIQVLSESAPDADEHVAILAALPRLYQTTVPALVAALDVKQPVLRAELIEVIRRRGETGAVPFLWFLSAAPKEPELVRQRATEALVALTETARAKLPAARDALTREADRYYQHRVGFPEADVTPEERKAFEEKVKAIPGGAALQPVVVWRWDGKQLLKDIDTPSQAEEYYGLRFTRQALDLDPAYQPTQVVRLSLILDKAYERVGLDQPLPDATRQLLTTINPDLLVAALERGLIDRRLPAILGTVRTLGELADVRAARATGHGLPALVRALNYPDRRVQMAAADALLRIPGSASSLASARVVDVLRRMLAAEPEPKAEKVARVVVGQFNADRAAALARVVQQAGFDCGPDETVRTGRDVMRRLALAADVDAIVIDSALPNPGLPYLLAQLGADNDSGHVPVLVLTPSDQELRLRRLNENYRNVYIVPAVLSRDPAELKKALTAAIIEATGQPLTKEERKLYAAEAMRWLDRMAVGEVQGYDVRPAQTAILRALRSDDLAGPAIETTGRLPGPQPQHELAKVVLNDGRDPKLRAAAAYELGRHIQEHGVALTGEQVRALRELFAAKVPDPKLQANVARIIGSMRPDAVQTGVRLRDFAPPAPAAPPPPEKKEEK